MTRITNQGQAKIIAQERTDELKKIHCALYNHKSEKFTVKLYNGKYSVDEELVYIAVL
jgi:hypothetical protein